MPANAGTNTEWQCHPALARAVTGRFTLDRHRTGIFIHTTDTVENQNTDVVLERPRCLTLGVLLEGEMEFTLRGQRHHLQANDRVCCELFAIVTATQESLVRHVRRQRRLRKLLLTVEPPWIAQQTRYAPELGQQLNSLLEEGSQCVRWPGDQDILALAEKILHPAPTSPALQQLQAEYHAVELLEKAFRLREMEQTQPGKLALERARRYIELHLDSQPSLESIAAHAGLSVSSLQRQFKSRHGQTVMHYIRDCKLQHARTALLRNEMTIGQAAFHAGYKHTSNFVTAYKRAFGVTPGTEN